MSYAALPPLFRERPFIEGRKISRRWLRKLLPPLFRERPFIEGRWEYVKPWCPCHRRSFGSGLSLRDPSQPKVLLVPTHRRSFGSGLSLRGHLLGFTPQRKRKPPLFRERPFIEGVPMQFFTPEMREPPLFRERPFIEGRNVIVTQVREQQNRRSFGSGLSLRVRSRLRLRRRIRSRRSFGSGLSLRDANHQPTNPQSLWVAALSGAAFH